MSYIRIVSKPVGVFALIFFMVFGFGPPAQATTLIEVEQGDTLYGIVDEHVDSAVTRSERRDIVQLLAALNEIETTTNENGQLGAQIIAGQKLDVGIFVDPTFEIKEDDSVWTALRSITPFATTKQLHRLVLVVGYVNNLDEGWTVIPGQVLQMTPVNQMSNVSVPAHIRTVRRGDALIRIARVIADAAGQPELATPLVYLIADLNGIEDINDIMAGTELQIPAILRGSSVHEEQLAKIRDKYAEPEDNASNDIEIETQNDVVTKDEEGDVPPRNQNDTGQGNDDPPMPPDAVLREEEATLSSEKDKTGSDGDDDPDLDDDVETAETDAEIAEQAVDDALADADAATIVAEQQEAEAEAARDDARRTQDEAEAAKLQVSNLEPFGLTGLIESMLRQMFRTAEVANEAQLRLDGETQEAKAAADAAADAEADVRQAQAEAADADLAVAEAEAEAAGQSADALREVANNSALAAIVADAAINPALQEASRLLIDADIAAAVAAPSVAATKAMTGRAEAFEAKYHAATHQVDEARAEAAAAQDAVSEAQARLDAAVRGDTSAGQAIGNGTIVDIAIEEQSKGVVEDSTNNDRQGTITMYRNGIDNEWEWCASFVSWVYNRAGIPLEGRWDWLEPAAMRMRTYTMEQNDWNYKSAEELRNGAKIVVGDIIFYGSSLPGRGHNGIVVEVLGNGTIRTVDGNVGNKLSALGPFDPHGEHPLGTREFLGVAEYTGDDYDVTNVTNAHGIKSYIQDVVETRHELREAESALKIAQANVYTVQAAMLEAAREASDARFQAITAVAQATGPIAEATAANALADEAEATVEALKAEAKAALQQATKSEAEAEAAQVTLADAEANVIAAQLSVRDAHEAIVIAPLAGTPGVDDVVVVEAEELTLRPEPVEEVILEPATEPAESEGSDIVDTDDLELEAEHMHVEEEKPQQSAEHEATHAWTSPSEERIRSELSDEYKRVLDQKPTLKEAIDMYNSRQGDSWGPSISLEDTARLAYLYGFTGEDELITAITVAMGESGRMVGGEIRIHPFVLGDYNLNDDGDMSIGIWQIYYKVKWTEPVRDPESNLDPETNAGAAKFLRDALGWDTWSSYSHGNTAQYHELAREAAVHAGLISP